MLDTRLKNYSHSVITKLIVFAIVITCFTGAIVELINVIFLGVWESHSYHLLVYTIGLMASFIYLAVVTGKDSFKDEKVHMNIIDGLYTDINVLICLGLIMLWFAIVSTAGLFSISTGLIPVTVFIAVPGLILVLSLIKHIKNRTFIKHSLVYNITRKIYQILKMAFDNGDIGVKTLLMIVIYSILVSVTNYLSLVVIAVGAWYALRKVEAFSTIRKGVGRIKSGDLNYKIELEDGGELKKLADDINSIADGLNEAVKDAVKSERLKTELITNVSHDIRTPLTSIITYVDLLKNEEDRIKAKEYIEIIDQKAQRLKSLTDDLFEASKASSGDIPVNYEKIDIVSLMKQGLGEMHDRVEESGLEFKINAPGNQAYVKADGKLLWRAIENLLSNIFKYALKGSRVYVDIEDEGDKISLALKNISAYELNVSPDELMERFKRGDESRSSQGSGLGLSIAKSLVEIQGGLFGIEIDGDLFKAVIKMPKYREMD